MEFEEFFTWTIGHGIVAHHARRHRKLKLRILARGKIERSAGDELEAKPQDVMGEVGTLRHAASHHTRRVDHELFGIQAPNHHVAPHLRTTCQHDAAAAILGGQGVLGIFKFQDVTGHEFAAAGTAVARLAAVGKADAV